MMITVEQLASKLMEKVAMQRTPYDFTSEDYCSIAVEAIKRLYIDTGRALEYIDGADGYEMQVDEEEYCVLLCQINFFKRVQCDVNNIVSYTTDALSITGAAEPYKHLQDSIALLEQERRIIYYKMNRFIYEG